MFTTSTGEVFYHPPTDPAQQILKVRKGKAMAPPHRIEDDGFDVSIDEVPVTVQRRPFLQDRGDGRLKDPGR
jgi:hypothetical protein